MIPKTNKFKILTFLKFKEKHLLNNILYKVTFSSSMVQAGVLSLCSGLLPCVVHRNHLWGYELPRVSQTSAPNFQGPAQASLPEGPSHALTVENHNPKL